MNLSCGKPYPATIAVQSASITFPFSYSLGLSAWTKPLVWTLTHVGITTGQWQLHLTPVVLLGPSWFLQEWFLSGNSKHGAAHNVAAEMGWRCLKLFGQQLEIVTAEHFLCWSFLVQNERRKHLSIVSSGWRKDGYRQNKRTSVAMWDEPLRPWPTHVMLIPNGTNKKTTGPNNEPIWTCSHDITLSTTVTRNLFCLIPSTSLSTQRFWSQVVLTNSNLNLKNRTTILPCCDPLCTNFFLSLLLWFNSVDSEHG